MDDVNAFLAAVLPGLKAAETALHNGDAAPRKAIWSHRDPVSLFGAVTTRIGPDAAASAFDDLASRFSNCAFWDYEILSAGASGDLAYLVGIEHTNASIGGAEPLPYELRVTTIFRREDGEWKIIHRHGDPLPGDDSTPLQLGRLGGLRGSANDGGAGTSG
jgi:ketosteroid isomerase-like protein